MSARTAEVIQIQSPIKKQIQHLGGSQQKKFPELLNEVVRRLRKNDFKLIHVTKSYRKNGTIRSDNFWKREMRIENVKILWLCRQTVVFNGGFKFIFDFDYWYEFSKLTQVLRGELYERGFPFTSRPYAKEFGKKEATRTLEDVKETVNEKLKGTTDGWGKHGIIQEVTDRKSLDICHLRKIEISSISELDSFRTALSEVIEEPEKLLNDSEVEIYSFAKNELRDRIPLQIDPLSLEGYLAFFLWFRNPGGGFEYQLYRFVWENFDNFVEKEDIKDALLRLEVHGYAHVKETPKKLVRKLKNDGIKGCERFYELGHKNIPGEELHDKLVKRTHIGAYLAPLSRKKLIRLIDAPDHIVNRKIGTLERRNYLARRKVKDFLGRTVKKVKPKRNPRGCSGLERRIMEEASKFYEDQKNSLDEMQEGRPE